MDRKERKQKEKQFWESHNKLFKLFDEVWDQFEELYPSKYGKWVKEIKKDIEKYEGV